MGGGNCSLLHQAEDNEQRSGLGLICDCSIGYWDYYRLCSDPSAERTERGTPWALGSRKGLGEEPGDNRGSSVEQIGGNGDRIAMDAQCLRRNTLRSDGDSETTEGAVVLRETNRVGKKRRCTDTIDDQKMMAVLEEEEMICGQEAEVEVEEVPQQPMPQPRQPRRARA